MTPRGSRALPALFLLALQAAGLNLYSASSTTAPTPSNIVTSGRTESDDPAATVTGSTSVSTMPIGVATTSLSLNVSLRLTEHDTVAVSKVTTPAVALLTTTPPSKSLEATTLSTASLSSQPNTGLQSTEHMPASVTSVVSLTENTIPHSKTPATTSSPVIHAASTIVTSTNTANLSTSDITHLRSMETSAARSKNLSAEEAISGKTPVVSTLPGPTEGHTFSEVTLANKPTSETSRIDSTTLSSGTSGITMQDVQHALSSGSIAAITITVIAVVLLVFGIAAFLKIRHSSYGRLLDDHDYGSWGNYNNPLYDDS